MGIKYELQLLLLQNRLDTIAVDNAHFFGMNSS